MSDGHLNFDDKLRNGMAPESRARSDAGADEMLSKLDTHCFLCVNGEHPSHSPLLAYSCVGSVFNAGANFVQFCQCTWRPQDGELQSRASGTPSDSAMAAGNCGPEGNPSSSASNEPSAMTETPMEREPVSADSKGQPRQDEASLPIEPEQPAEKSPWRDEEPLCRCGHPKATHTLLKRSRYLLECPDEQWICEECRSHRTVAISYIHDYAPDPRDLRIAELEARVADLQGGVDTQLAWCRLALDAQKRCEELEASVTELQAEVNKLGEALAEGRMYVAREAESRFLREETAAVRARAERNEAERKLTIAAAFIRSLVNRDLSLPFPMFDAEDCLAAIAGGPTE